MTRRDNSKYLILADDTVLPENIWKQDIVQVYKKYNKNTRW